MARQEVSTGRWTLTVFDAAGNPLSELARTSDAANPWRKVRDYVWLDGRPLAQIEYPGPAGRGEGYAYYFHVDHLGLPRALSNEAGQVVWSASVTPYGEVVETTATDPLSGTTVVTNLRLPGQYDERLFAAAGISGMQGPYYNWNRWYLPSVGRYMELDPIALDGDINGFATPDWYSYALANPLTNTDPQGTQVAEGAAGGALVCGPPCALAGALAGLGAAAVIGKIGSDALNECSKKKPKTSKNCGCICLDHGGVRQYIGAMPEYECADSCLGGRPPHNKVFPGYQCGGKPFWRITPVK